MQRKRNRQFVDRSVQGAIALRLVTYLAVFLVAVGGFVYFIELLSGAPRDAGRHLASRHGPTALAALVLAPVFLRDLCKLTNRFAGPMVRLRRTMRELADGGDVPPIQFREHDFWNDVACDFNRVLERLRVAEANSDAATVTPVKKSVGGGTDA